MTARPGRLPLGPPTDLEVGRFEAVGAEPEVHGTVTGTLLPDA